MKPETSKRSKELFQLVVENVRDFAVFMTDTQGHILSWNPGVKSLLGYDESEFVGRQASIIFTPEDRGQGVAEQEMRAALVDGRAEDKRWHVRRDGSRFWANGMLMLLRDDNGEARGFAKILRDDTELLRAEQRRAGRVSLRADVSDALASAGSLQDVLQQCCEALVGRLDAALARIWTLEPGGGVLEMKASAGLYSDPDSDARHQLIPVGKLKIGSIAENRRPHLTNDVPGDEHMSNKEGLAREGIIAFAGYPLLVEGRVVGVMALFAREPLHGETLDTLASVADAIAQEIERKRAEEQRDRLLASEQEAREEAEQANRLKDEFLATLSHELRTPLTAILGWARLLAAGQVGADGVRAALESIERNATAQAQLVDDVLDVSRIITGKLRTDVRPVDLASVIRGASDSVRLAAEAKNIELQQVFDPVVGFVSGDPHRLQQVVWNLLSNAIKFTPPGGRVRLFLKRDGPHAEITVSDTGKGISPDVLPHVFERFRQADSSTTRAHGGLGLGLAIVRHLVELHGGTAEAESEGDGRGATFRVRIPLTTEPPAAADPEAAPGLATRWHGAAGFGSPQELEGVHVLVVDDEEDARSLIAAILGNCGARVTAIGSSAEALREIEHARPDVLVSDIGMPGEDGYELIRKVRALPAGRGGETPAAALTAYVSAEDRARALRAGFQTHVSKPVEPAELVAVVADLAGHTASG